jgi:hypothetical protein
MPATNRTEAPSAETNPLADLWANAATPLTPLTVLAVLASVVALQWAPGRSFYRTGFLGMALGRAGTLSRGPDRDDHQIDQRSCRSIAAIGDPSQTVMVTATRFHDVAELPI